MKSIGYTVVGLFMLGLACGAITKAQRLEPDPKAILRKMMNKYDSAKSYQDTGLVRITADQNLLKEHTDSANSGCLTCETVTLLTFKTYYSKPVRFRFEWKNLLQPSARKSMVWSDGNRAYRWMPEVSGDGTFEFVDSASLRFNLEWALKPTLGSIFLIPTLLMNDATFAPFSDTLRSATRTTIVGEQMVDGEICFVIKAELTGVPWLLWIDKQSYLLRKTRTTYSSGSFHDQLKGNGKRSVIAEEVHSDIKINQKIPRSVFSYRPLLPKRKDDSRKRLF